MIGAAGRKQPHVLRGVFEVSTYGYKMVVLALLHWRHHTDILRNPH